MSRSPRAARAAPAEDTRAAPAEPLSLVSGTVSGPDGPIEGAGVRFTRGVAAHRARAERGAYALAGLAPGEWKATASATGFQEATRTFTLAAGARERLDFELEPGWWVDVRFETPDGGDLVKALYERRLSSQVRALHAIATEDSPAGDLPATDLLARSSWGMGRWRRASSSLDVPDIHGRIHLDEPPPVHVSAVLRHLVLDTRRIETAPTTVTFQIDPELLASRLSGLRLRTVDAESGAPLEGVRVALDTAQSGGSGVPTDGDGRVELLDQIPGRMRLSVTPAPPHAQVNDLVDLAPGEVLDLGDVALAHGVPIALRFVDAAGAGVQTAVFFTHHVPDDPTSPFVRWGLYHWLTDQDGRMEGGALAPDLWLARVNTEDVREGGEGGDGPSAAPFVLDLRDGPQPLRTIVVSPTTRVRLTPRADADGLSYTLFAENRLPVTRGGLAAGSPEVLRLPPGQYALRVEDGGEPVAETPFSVGSEELRLEVGR